jgi:hypothetical protein
LLTELNTIANLKLNGNPKVNLKENTGVSTVSFTGSFPQIL